MLVPINRDTRKKEIKRLARLQDLEALKETWNALLAAGEDDLDFYFEVADYLAGKEHKSVASELLLAARKVYAEAGKFPAALEILRKIVVFFPAEAGLREMLLAAYRRTYGETEQLEFFLKNSGLDGEEKFARCLPRLDTFLAFRQGGYVFHGGGWGLGRIASVDYPVDSMVIDFVTKPGHHMALSVAAEVLKALPEQSRKVLAHFFPERWAALAREKPLEALRLVLEEYPLGAKVRDLKAALTPSAVAEKHWNSWWKKVRTEADGDPYIEIRGDKAQVTLFLRRKPVSREDELNRQYQRLKTTRERLEFVYRLVADHRIGPEQQEFVTVVRKDMLQRFSEEEGHTGMVLELCSLMEDLQQILPTVDFAFPSARGFLSHVNRAIAALQEMQIPAYIEKTLGELRGHFVEDWDRIFAEAFWVCPRETCDFLSAQLIKEGKIPRLQEVLDKILSSCATHHRLFIWLGRQCVDRRLPDSLRVPAPLEIFLTMLRLMEKAVSMGDLSHQKQIKEDCRQTVHDIRAFFALSGAGSHLREFLQQGAQGEVETLFYHIRISNGLTENLKEQVETILIRRFPKWFGEGAKKKETESSVVFVTQASYRRKTEEYNHLINVLIPENSKAIGEAQAMGDLSENAEFEAAIERHARLNTRARSLEEELKKTQVLDFSTVKTDRVCLGTRVTLRDIHTSEKSSLSLLGPWDFDDAKRIISYLSLVGRALLGRAVGEKLELNLDGTGVKRYYEVMAIDVWTPPTSPA